MEKITSEDYFDMKRVMDVRVTPDHVVWVEKTPNAVDRDYNSFLKLLDRKTDEIKQFTGGSDRDFNPRFSPDFKKLAFLSTRDETPQIYVMELNGGEALPLTSIKHGVQGFAWGPNGKQISFIADVDPNKEDDEPEKPRTKFEAELKKLEKEEEERKVKDPRVIDKITYRRGTSYDHPDRSTHIFVIDLDSKESRRLSDGYYNHTVPQFISEDEVISLSNREHPRDLSTKISVLRFTTDDTSQGELITKVENSWVLNPVANDKDLLFVNVMGEGNKAGQNTRWAQIQNGDVTVINEELDRSVNILRIIDESTLLVSVDDKGKTDIRTYDLNTGEFEQLFDEPISVIDFDASDTDEVYFTGTDPLHVWAIWKWSKSSGLELIEDPNEKLFKDKEIIQPEEFWLENPDGKKYQGWFFDAGEQDGTKPPLVLSIHGGPHAMWSNAGTMWHEWQVMLSAGYSILAMNPIGSQGYGEDFSQVITAKWGVDDARDVLSAVDHFIDRVDEDRLYITGGSYAGFQTANIISRDHRFKAACSQRGVYDLISFGLTTDIPLFSIWEWEGTPWDKLDHLWEHSPVGRAKEIQTPLLIIHAENDFRVAISQAEELFAALKLEDKEAVLVRYPRDGHELSRSGEPHHVVDRIDRIIKWFDTHP